MIPNNEASGRYFDGPRGREATRGGHDHPLPNFMLGRELSGSVSVVSAGGDDQQGGPKNDTPSNLARV